MDGQTGGRADGWTGIEGSTRGPCGPKKLPQDKAHLPILRHPSDDNDDENQNITTDHGKRR